MPRARPLPFLLVLPLLLGAPFAAQGAALDPPPLLSGDESRVGRWDPPQEWPVQGEFAALLPTGKVLAFVSGAGAHLWDPEDGSFEAVPGGAVNCAGLALMPDGRVLVNGGHRSAWRGEPDAWIFDPWNESWSRAADMNVGRYYPGTIQLADGSLLTVSGNGPDGMDATTPEVFRDGAWTLLPTADSWSEFYPRMHVLPDGGVARVGQDAPTRFLDTATWTWSDGPMPHYGLRWGGTSVLLPGLDKVLVVGGGALGASSEGWGPVPTLRDDAEHLQAHLLGPLHDPDATPATARTEILDLRGAAPAWRETAPMTYARRDHSTVLLPDGSVLAVGGAYGYEYVPGWVEHALHPERFDPRSETWSVMAPSDRHRGYHSVALLLPDARVLSAGGDFETGAGSVPGASRTGQVFSPPYLFQGPRPALVSAPARLAHGEAFSVEVEGDADRLVLVRLGSVTHSLNTDQRLLDLDAREAGGKLHARAPATPGEAPPGWYMLFALTGEGVPSVARMVRLGA